MTCSRLVTRGQLVVVDRKRPIELQAVAGVCTPVVDGALALAAAMFGICRPAPSRPRLAGADIDPRRPSKRHGPPA